MGIVGQLLHVLAQLLDDVSVPVRAEKTALAGFGFPSVPTGAAVTAAIRVVRLEEGHAPSEIGHHLVGVYQESPQS